MPDDRAAPRADGSMNAPVQETFVKLSWKTLLLCALALFIPVVVGVATSIAWVPLGRPFVNPDDGRLVFVKKCSQCHSVDPNAPSGLGPSLAFVGREAATRRPGVSATDYLIESIVAPAAFQASKTGRMPVNIGKNLSDATVRNVVAYLASLGAQPDWDAIGACDIAGSRPKSENVETAEIDLEQVERGRKLFLGEGKCVQCHTVRRSPESGVIAPSLLTMAMHDEKHLRESLENPSAVIAHGYAQHTVHAADGTTHSGRVLKNDGKQIVLLTMDAGGRLTPVTIPLEGEGADEVVVAPGAVSSMPVPTLSKEQIDDMVAFLISIRDTSLNEDGALFKP
jgi:putative heme-binding domain-containing protein